MTLTEILDKYRDGTRGPLRLAGLVLDDVAQRPPDEARDLLYPLVLEWVKAAERDRVRDDEQEVFAGPGVTRNPKGERPGRTDEFVNPAQQAMMQLLADTCYVPGHGRVPWGEMDVELHRVRITYLHEQVRRYTAGVTATVRRHEAAVELLKESSCTTLNDYAAEFGELPGALAPTLEERVTPA